MLLSPVFSLVPSVLSVWLLEGEEEKSILVPPRVPRDVEVGSVDAVVGLVLGGGRVGFNLTNIMP